MSITVTRRAVLAGATALAGGVVAKSYASLIPSAAKPFPTGFLWGVSTAGHQIEGNNTASDYWVMENVQPTLFRERSGDACDSYHRYEEDIALIRSFGLNSYRFSIEWARIEPNKGNFSTAELDYYKGVIEACHRNSVRPALTFHHNVSPAWFAGDGGWTNPESPKLFARYCDYVAKGVAGDIDMAFTINEPDVNGVVKWMPGVAQMMQQMMAGGQFPLAQMNAAAAKAIGSDKFSALLFAPNDVVTPNLIEAHHQSFAAIKSARSSLPVGVPLSVFQYRAVGENSDVDAANKDVLGPWLEAAKRSGDFVGVQNYGAIYVDSTGAVMAKGHKGTNPFETDPTSLGATVRYVHQATGKPIIVTENGIDTTDDNVRIAYIDQALAGLQSAIADGVPVQGYFHWSLLDNFEWMSGFGPKFGLVAVDRATFKRTPKPSARHLGDIATKNSL
jgi:beta-glucosidase